MRVRSVIGQCVLIVMAASQRASLERLTRWHGVKVMPAERCSVEDYVLAVAAVAGHDCILSVPRMNSAIVIFLSNVDKVNRVVETGITVNDSLTPSLGLSPNSRRFEEPDSTTNLTVEYSRGVMIMTFWLYGGAQCLISHITTGFLHNISSFLHNIQPIMIML